MNCEPKIEDPAGGGGLARSHATRLLAEMCKGVKRRVAEECVRRDLVDPEEIDGMYLKYGVLTSDEREQLIEMAVETVKQFKVVDHQNELSYHMLARWYLAREADNLLGEKLGWILVPVRLLTKLKYSVKVFRLTYLKVRKNTS